MSRLRLQFVAAAIFALTWIQLSRLEPQKDSGVLPTDPPTPYLHYAATGDSRGRVLVVHGLDASKEPCEFISAALADGGFEVFAIDLPGHGDSRVPFSTQLAQQAIRSTRTALGDTTVVLGHSLGAGLLLDLAATDTFSTLVLLSPPPIAISEIHAGRVLIATGDIDIPRIQSFVPIATDIGGPHVESWLLPWGAHSSPIFNPRFVERIVDWLGGDGARTKTGSRIVLFVLMFGAAVVFGAGFLPKRPFETHPGSTSTILVYYVAAGSIALFALRLFNPFRWLHLFATDYLIAFVFLAGITLSIAALSGRRSFATLHRWHIGLLAAVFFIAIPGLAVSSRVLHLTLSGDRWWRFPCVAVASLPLFLSDELLIRRIGPRWKSEGVAVLTRILLVLFMITGTLTLNRESAFLLLILPLVAFFWIILWIAAGIVHRHTQSAMAAALFAALVQGWAFAALFVTI